MTRQKKEPDQRHWLQRYGKRLLVLVAGGALLIGGLIMLITPGPGAILIIAGLAVLASEFDWAERWLDRAKERFDDAARKAGVDPKKAAIGGILFVGLIAIGGTVAWFMLR